MISLEDCIEKGLIKKIAASPKQARDLVEKAKALSLEAKGAVESDRPNLGVLGGYSAMFMAARALLFRDGYRERSHACVARYIEANYKEKINTRFIDLLDQYRTKRHKVVYGADYYPSVEEARNVVECATEFIPLIEELIKI